MRQEWTWKSGDEWMRDRGRGASEQGRATRAREEQVERPARKSDRARERRAGTRRPN